MKKQLVFIILFVCSLVVRSANEAETIVRNFYQKLEIIVNEPPGDATARAKLDVCKYFPSNDFPLPNEFPLIGYNKAAEKGKELIVSTYVNILEDISQEGVLRFAPTIVSSSSLKNPELLKGEDEAHFAEVKVSKVYYFNGHKTVLTDVVCIDMIKREIVKLVNQATSNTTNNSHHNTVENINTVNDLSSLKLQAYYCYTRKEYDEAYKLFSLITEQYQDGDAFYNLAIMSHKRQGCKNLSRKDTRKNTITFLEKAERFGDSRTSAKASTVLYWIDNGNKYNY